MRLVHIIFTTDSGGRCCNYSQVLAFAQGEYNEEIYCEKLISDSERSTGSQTKCTILICTSPMQGVSLRNMHSKIHERVNYRKPSYSSKIGCSLDREETCKARPSVSSSSQVILNSARTTA